MFAHLILVLVCVLFIKAKVHGIGYNLYALIAEEN